MYINEQNIHLHITNECWDHPNSIFRSGWHAAACHNKAGTSFAHSRSLFAPTSTNIPELSWCLRSSNRCFLSSKWNSKCCVAIASSCGRKHPTWYRASWKFAPRTIPNGSKSLRGPLRCSAPRAVDVLRLVLSPGTIVENKVAPNKLPMKQGLKCELNQKQIARYKEIERNTNYLNQLARWVV